MKQYLWLYFLILMVPERAWAFACGDTVMTSTTLSADVVCSGGFAGNALTIGADGVTLDGGGYKIIMDSSGTGVHLDGFNSVTLTNLDISTASNTGTGIYLANTITATITNNNLSGRYNGIDSGGTYNQSTFIDGNDVSGASSSYGMMLRNFDDLLYLANNTFGGNSGGLYLDGMTGGTWTLPPSNDFTGVGNFVVLYLTNTEGVTLNGLDLMTESVEGTGIYLNNTTDTVVTNNLLNGRTVGVETAGTNTGLQISGNDASDGLFNYGFVLQNMGPDLIFTNNIVSGRQYGVKIESQVGPWTLSPNNDLAGVSTVGLYMHGSSDVVVDGFDLSGVGGTGIILSSVTGVQVTNNLLMDRNIGVQILGSNNNGLVITGNDASGGGSDYGFVLNNLDSNAVFTNNDMSGRAKGLYLFGQGGPWTVDTSNIFTSVSNTGILAQSSGDLTIAGHTISGGATSTGVHVVNCANISVTNNVLTGHMHGIHLTGSINTNATLIGNDVSGPGTGYGIAVSGVDAGLVLENNTFANRDFGLSISGLVGPWSLGFNDFAGVTTGTVVYVANSSDISITEQDLSSSSGLGTGLYLHSVSTVSVIGNDFSGRARGINSAGVNTGMSMISVNDVSNSTDTGIYLYGFDNNLMLDSNIYGGSDVGLGIRFMTGPWTFDGTMADFAPGVLTEAVFVQDGSDVTIMGVNVVDSPMGVRLLDCDACTVQSLVGCGLDTGVSVGSCAGAILGSGEEDCNTGASGKTSPPDNIRHLEPFAFQNFGKCPEQPGGRHRGRGHRCGIGRHLGDEHELPRQHRRRHRSRVQYLARRQRDHARRGWRLRR